MSRSEEATQKNNVKESEIRLQEDDEDNESHRRDKNMRMSDFLKTTQRDKRTISPLSLLKEDFSQFKEDMMKVFKDKDSKTEREEHPLNLAENRLLSSTLDLLKEDFSQFKEDVTSVFSISSSKDKETKPAEKMTNPLSFLKEDFNLLKDDLSNAFKISLSKEKDAAKDDSSNILKIKVSRAEKSLFRRDQKTENSHAAQKIFSETREEQKIDGFRGNFSEQKEETVDAEKINNNTKHRTDELEDIEVDRSVCEDKMDTTTCLSDTRQSEEMILSLQAAEQRRDSEERSSMSPVMSAGEKRTTKDAEEEQTSETLGWASLSAGIGLFSLRDSNTADTGNQPGGELWSVKNFAYYLTFDPNTANSELHLTDCSRKATRVWSDHRPLDHPDRFERCPQLLCREGLLDSAYWEVMWSGGADIGVTYNSISRDGAAVSCLLGHNACSWSLECSEGSYTPCHDNKRLRSCSPRPFTRRVGVYLNWSAGSLSFYCVSQDSMVHLHTFTSTFTEPLYPGFWLWAYDGSVSLCQVELDWERLLQ